MTLGVNPRKVGESRVVSGHDRPSCRPCSRGDNKVMRSSRPTLAAHRDEQLCMGFCDVEVVVEDGDRRDHVVDEALPPHSRCPSRQLDADFQLGNRDRRDCNVVIVRDRVTRRVPGAFSVDEVRRVEKKSRQCRSSMVTSSRIASSSPRQDRSTACLRSIVFTSEPCPAVIGSMQAMALPRRTIVIRSPRCSTASSSSAK
jgi:hypothetical protein